MTRRTRTLVIFCLVSSVIAFGQARRDPPSEPQTILLWENGAPGALGQGDDDKPSITVYRPWGPNRSGTSVIVAPGGGYGFLASNHEGRQVANWFNAMGVTAFVLKYRLGPRYHHPIELGDAQRAIRMVRSRAKEFEISPDRIGMMGFSAGGHLASTAATHFDGGNPGAADPIDHAGSRPDFVILGYPVITLEAPYAHGGSARNLLGEQSRSQAGSGTLQRTSRHAADSAHIFVHHQRRYCSAGREQRELLSGAAQSGRPGGNACVRKGSARSRS